MTIKFLEHGNITEIGGFQHNNVLYPKCTIFFPSCGIDYSLEFKKKLSGTIFCFFFNRLHMEVHPAQPKLVRFSIICFIDIYHLCNILAEFIFIWI